MSALHGFEDNLQEEEIESIFNEPVPNRWGYPLEVNRNTLWGLQIEMSRPCEEPAYSMIDEILVPLVDNTAITWPLRHSTIVPRPLLPINDIIVQSRSILELEDDWDGDGSHRYSEETWRNATDFLMRNAISLYNRFQLVVDSPNIHNGPDGSIDIYWDTQKGKLLINVLPESEELSSFYGCSTTGQEIKGRFSLNADNLWLLLWQAGK